MSYIVSGNTTTKFAVSQMIDDTTITPATLTFTNALVGGVRQLTAHFTSSTVMLDGQFITTPASNDILINELDVVVPTTYYVYIRSDDHVISAEVSTLNPASNPALEEYALGCIVRMKSVSGVLTIYWTKQPSQNGIYETVHNLREDTVFSDPKWISGIELTMSAGGKISTTAGYVRFPSNEPRPVVLVTEGGIALDNESVIAGIDEIITYSDDSAITATKWHKLLVGTLRGKAGANTTYYIVARQGRPGTEYASAAAAASDAENVAATSFPSSYMGAVTPIYYLVTKVGDYSAVGFTALDIRASGIIKGGSAATPTVSHHTLVDLTGYDDHSQYIPASGARGLTGNWNAGAFTITAKSLTSSVADGTAPFTSTSGTVCTNVNADKLDGLHKAGFIQADGTQALTGDWAAAKNITTVGNLGGAAITASGLSKALTFESTEAVLAPIVVASTAKVTNLNADQLDGKNITDVLLLDGTQAMTGALAMGSKSITAANDVGCATVTATGLAKALTLQSTQATGTAPLAVASTTVVTNLNADTVDAIHGTDLVKKDGTVTMTGALNMGSKSITAADDVGCATVTATGLAKALTLESTQATGTAPLAVASTTVVTNLNADTVDAIHGTDLVKKDGTVTMTGALNMGSKSITAANDVGCTTVTATGLTKALTLESTQATGTAPLTVASTTMVTNLNANTVNGKASTDLLLVDGTQAMTGGLNMGSKAITAASAVTTTGLAKALTFESTQATGTAPLVVASTTKVTNLNADQLDGLDSLAFLKADGTVQLTGNQAVTAGVTIDGVDISVHAATANAHHNPVTLAASADALLGLSTQDLSLDTQATSTVLAGPIVGATTPAAPTFRQLNVQDIATPSGTMTLANGVNNNVALTAGTRVYIVAGPSAAFNITGFTGGVDGAVIYLYSPIAKNMTITYDSANSSVGNRIYTSTGADVATTNVGMATFVYIAGTTNHWLLMSIST